ncbi:MAG: PD-(D/E)XK nuclease family protein [Chloroflexi bacterium]|nr:PD-(D/E)XK nuclease family protein [Chloroflexota bacterium]
MAEYLGSPTLAKSGISPLIPLIELASIRHIAIESGADGPLSAVAQHEGLPGLLRRTFRELSRLDANDLSALAKTDNLRAQLVDWYRLFKQDNKKHYVHEDLVQAAEGAVARGTAADTLRDIGFVVFYLLNDLTQAELRLAKRLINMDQAGMILGMVGEPAIDEDTLRIITSIDDGVGAGLTGCDYESLPPVQLLSAPDSREEIRWIVRDIARRSEAGTPFHKIAVLYRQQEPYASLISTQLALAGIATAGPNPAPLSSTPSGKSLLGMLAAMNSDLSRSAVLKWLSECPVKVNSDGQDSRGLLADWEVISRRAGIVKGIDQWEERLEALLIRVSRLVASAEELEETSPAKLEGLRRMSSAIPSLRIFVKDFAVRTSVPSGDTWGDLSRWIKRLLEHFSWSEEDWPSGHRVTHERLLGILDEFSSLDQSSLPPTKEVFLEILEQLLEAPSGRFGETGSGVFVAPVETAKGMVFDAVYMVGMCEGDFPAPPPQDSLLPYETRETVGGGLVLDSQRTFRIKERRAFLTAQASSEQYILTCPRADSSSQRPRFPSPWFMDALQALHGSSVTSADIPQLANETWMEVIQSPLHSLESTETVSAADIHDRDVASVSRWQALGKDLKDHYLATTGGAISRSIAMNESRWSSQVTGWDGDVSGHLDAGRVLQQEPLSATGLESWARCPFSYFLGNVLGLRALDSPEDVLTISPRDRGSLVHRILERLVHEEIKLDDGSGGRKIEPQEQVRLLHSIADEEFNRAEARGLTGKPLLWAAAKDEILRDLSGFLDTDRLWLEEQELDPMWAEKSFGFGRGDSLEPLKITLKDGSELSFRGMIDRVDISKDKKRIVVTDYKTGSSYPYRNMDKDPLDAGRRLQLPLYSLAVKRALDGVEEAQGSYWFVSASSNFDRKFIDLTQVEERFNEIIEGISTGIQSGLFPANPGPQGQFGPENCSYCDFARICPTAKAGLWDRKKDDVRLASYIGLSGQSAQQEDE